MNGGQLRDRIDEATRPPDSVALLARELREADEAANRERARERLAELSRSLVSDAEAIDWFRKRTDRAGLGRSVSVGFAVDQLISGMARPIAKREPSLSPEQAFVEALRSQDGIRLYDLGVSYDAMTLGELGAERTRLLERAAVGVTALEQAG